MSGGRLGEARLIVTGGSGGIGRAAAIRFAQEGARVLVADRDVRGGEETCERIREAGGAAWFHETEVSQEASVRDMVGQAVARLGGLTGAFNNAGYAEPTAAFDETDFASWQAVLAVDLSGVFLCMKHEIAHLRRSGGGSIVNTSSVAGLVCAPGRVAYTAAKHGVLGLTKHAAREFARDGIRVNAICPGLIDTAGLRGSLDAAGFAALAERTAPGRVGQPREVADVAAWLLSADSSYVSGESIVVDHAGLTR
ncbi:MAG: SDR family NAD(P)-dependent oxidoreductase [Myxococcota bacterium]